jgi:hypothetical protein
MDHFTCIPSEILEKIVGLVLKAVERPVEAAERNAKSIALVSRSWNAAMNTVGWDALLFRHLGTRVHCEPEDALWLFRMLRSHEIRMNITQARKTFRLSSKDLKTLTCLVPLEGTKKTWYATQQLVALAVKKHGGIPAFRVHMTKCKVSTRLSRGPTVVSIVGCSWMEFTERSNRHRYHSENLIAVLSSADEDRGGAARCKGTAGRADARGGRGAQGIALRRAPSHEHEGVRSQEFRDAPGSARQSHPL